MAERPEENIEMRYIDPPPEENEGVEETNVDARNLIDESLRERTQRIRSGFKNVSRQIGVEMRSYTEDKKKFLREQLGIKLNKADSPVLFDNIELSMSADRTRVNGMTFKGKKIVVQKEGRLDYSTAQANVSAVNEFKELVRNAEYEHARTAGALIEEQLPDGTSESVVSDVLHNSVESLENYIDDRFDKVVRKGLPPNVLREIRGVLQGGVFDQEGPVEDKLRAMEVDRQHWLKMSEEAVDENLKLLYKRVADIEELQMDVVRLRYNLKPETAIAKEIIANEAQTNDLARFERLKQWLKKNFGTISGVMVGVAGIVTAVVAMTRTYVRKGARAVKSFAKGVAKVAEKVGPLIGAVLGLVGKVLGASAKGLTFLANNLWLLVLFLFGYLYKKYTYTRTQRTNKK